MRLIACFRFINVFTLLLFSSQFFFILFLFSRIPAGLGSPHSPSLSLNFCCFVAISQSTNLFFFASNMLFYSFNQPLRRYSQHNFDYHSFKFHIGNYTLVWYSHFSAPDPIHLHLTRNSLSLLCCAGSKFLHLSQSSKTL